MQTRKKILVTNVSREQANHRFCRQQKKVTLITEKKVAEMITSSAKKQKHVGILQKKKRDAEHAKNLNTSHALPQFENDDSIVAIESSSDHETSDGRAAQCVMENIFSPAFHLTKDICGGDSGKGDFQDHFRIRDQAGHENHAVENPRIDTLNYPSTLENQHKSIEIRLEGAPECACDTNTDTMTRSPSPMDPDKRDNHCYMPHMKSNHASSCRDEEYTVLENLSSEVSAIYLAMQHSKLECVDEPSHDSMSIEGSVESDEDDEFDDFDPYLFIKNLPNLSTIVPTFRPTLLPKQTRSCPSTTLVLDLDETLVHSTLDPCEDADFTFPVNFNLKDHTIYVRCRPFLKDFMERVASLFEIIIFTASQSIYAEQLLNILDPKRKLFRHRVYRESCVYVEGNYLKDLSVLGRDLARIIIVDNSPQAFGFQVDNGIPIESWFDDRADRELISLLPFLESLVGVEDVRPLIAKKFNLREKVATAACLPMDF